MTLETPLLRTLVAVSETGSFTRAATQVHRTQSAVSMQIKRLEDAVGKPLVTRDRRQAQLTREGVALVEYARRILNLHDEAMAAVSQPEIAGLVRIGTPDDYAAGFLPQVLSDFAETHPNVEVDLRCETSSKICRAFEKAEVDVALVTSGSWLKGGEIIRREPHRMGDVGASYGARTRSAAARGIRARLFVSRICIGGIGQKSTALPDRLFERIHYRAHHRGAGGIGGHRARPQ